MIGFIRGRLESKDINSDRITVDVNGVGYEILMSNIDSFTTSGEEVKVFTYFHVTDKGQTLYGFRTQAEKMFFLQLINISDIGPKVAISILSGMELNKLKSAIASGDTSLLQTISRVGKKLAGRIVIELKDKLKDQKIEAYESKVAEDSERDVIAALVSLGFSQNVSRNAVASIRSKFTDNVPDIQELIIAALKEVTK